MEVKERGQSLVELGVSFLILMFLLLGAAEFGIVFFQYVQLMDAAQEGAVFGSYCQCSVEEIESRIRSSSNAPLDLKDDSVSIVVTAYDLSGNSKPIESSCESDALEVQASYAHKIIMPFMSRLIGRDEILLKAAVINTVLRPVCS